METAVPTVQQFREYIQRIRLKAADQNVETFELDAEGIHTSVAGKSHAYTDIEACRTAMKMEMKPGDKVLHTGNGKKTNLTVAYKS
ncbi:hypothetical protein [Asticcacaulis sp. W401b]|uniref:hypothetical protein n=1 Tax=Asticcacaulis sp. W401b TaxID=3388666 RepID=UPI00397088C1